MLDFAIQLQHELISKLDNLDISSNVQCYTPVESKELIALAIKRLKEELKIRKFESEIEEICFFRAVMPFFLSLYIHQGEMMRLNLVMKNYSIEDRQSCLQIFHEEKDAFYRKNAEFIDYCRSGKDDLDQIYFLCAGKFDFDCDELISETMKFPLDMVYTITLATMMAYEVAMPQIRRLELELKMESRFLTFRGNGLTWTGSVTDLTELIYTFQKAGCFNDGKVSVKQIAKYFEYVFSIDLGNTSSNFQKIKSRKGEITYIDKLKEYLNRKIDDTDRNRLGQ
jgi:RteC protein